MSVAGDALLVWEELFVHGLAAFLLAQLCYISAFGFRPFNLYVATVSYCLAALGEMTGCLLACLIPIPLL